MNKIIIKILKKIERKGYQAYIVGGFVRDKLLGKASFDVDITTNAPSEALEKIFKIKPNEYGVISLKVKNYNIDITSFRKEEYKDNRYPHVSYTSSLLEDLQRRDFTINAICMNRYENLVDPLYGYKDLNKHLIKGIGDIEEKLKEDPLRILRAIRFATVLDFDLDAKLKDAITTNYQLINNLSKTRIKKEMDKILANENFLKGLELLKEFKILDILGITYKEVKYVPYIMGMYAQIDAPNLAFTNEGKKSIMNIAKIKNGGEINRETLQNYSLEENIIAGAILGKTEKEVKMLYKKEGSDKNA